MKKLVLKPHQNKAKQDILYSTNGLLNNNRAKFISACGTGKTLSALVTCEEYIFDIVDTQNSKIAFFYPTLALVSQSFKTYVRESRIDNYKPLFICSDKSIAAIDDEDITLDEFKEEIGDYPVTTNAEDVIAYLLDESIEHKVVYSTYQSSHILAKATMQLNMRFNFSTFDEAHNVALKNNSKESAQTVILHDIDFPNEFGLYFECDKRLFMTATPKHFELKDEDDNEISFEDTRLAYSMDDIRYFGEIAHEYSMRDAINDGVIADYQIVAITIDDEYIKAFKDKHSYDDNELFEVIKTYAMCKAIQKYNINKSIVFEKNISCSKKLVSFVKQIDTQIKIEHIDGFMNHAEKNARLEFLKNTNKAILTNSKLLSEGIDVAEIDLVSFMSASSSIRDIIQRVGRVQRLGARKDKIGYVFVPIITHHKDNETKKEFNRQNKDINNLYNIINSLSESDSYLKDVITYKIKNITHEEYQELIEDIAYYSSIVKPSKDELIIYRRLEKRLRLYEQIQLKEPLIIANIRDIVNDIKVSKDENSEETVNRFIGEINQYINATILGSKNNEEKWEKAFAAFQAYYLKNKGLPPKNHIYEGINISRFYIYQRTLFNCGEIEQNKYDKLISVCDYIFDTYSEQWLKRAYEFGDYIKKHNELPKQHSKEKFKDGALLYTWYAKQRTDFLNKSLSEEQIGTLTSIYEDIFKNADDVWEEKRNLVAEYFNKYNKLPTNSLLNWVIAQRKLLREKKLSKERMDSLNAISPFILLNKKEIEDLEWEETFKKVKFYFEKVGNITNDELPNDVKNWINIQRKSEYKKENHGILTPDRIRSLEEMDRFFFKNKQDATWDYMLDLTLNFIEEHKRIPKENESHKNEKIGQWLKGQIKRYRGNKLGEQKYEKLSSNEILHVVLENSLQNINTTWEQWFELLVSFKNEYNITPLPNEKYKNVLIGKQSRKLTDSTEEQKRRILEVFPNYLKTTKEISFERGI